MIGHVEGRAGHHRCCCGGRSQAEVARAYGVSPGWVSRLLARYRADGKAAFTPRSRRPTRSPAAIPAATVELIVRLRKELADQGLDAGPETICWHLAHHHATTVSAATVSRYLTRAGLVSPAPKKRPRSSYVRFAAELPNECWQTDFTHYRLGDGTDAEILCWLDDHSRYALSVTAHRRVTGPTVVATFRETAAQHGVPAWTLTDNAMVYTTRFAGGRGGRNAFRGRTAPAGCDPEELPTGPPHHLRQGRTIPANRQTVAGRPTGSAGLDRPAANPARDLHRHLQPAPAAPVPTQPGHPRGRLPGPAQSHPQPRAARRRHPPPHPPRPGRRHRRGPPPTRQPAAPHRHRPNPRPNPHPAARPRPAHPGHQRRHRRTPTRTNPRPHPRLPAHRPTPGPARKTNGPSPNVGSVRFLCLERSHWCPRQESNLRHPL